MTTTPSTLLVNITTAAADFSCENAPVIPLEPLCGNSGAGYIGGIPKEVVGDILVIVSQIIVSFQMVYEEKVLSNYAIAPLQAVGSEGEQFLHFLSCSYSSPNLWPQCSVQLLCMPPKCSQWTPSEISFIRSQVKRARQAPTLPLSFTSLSLFSPHCS